jgi:hypothetical protein
VKAVDLEAMIDDAIKKMIGNRIMHLEVKPPFYTQSKLVLASEYVRREFLEALRYQEEEVLVDYLRLLGDIPFRMSAVGLMFRRLANRQLSAGGDFLVRSLDDESERVVNFPSTNSRIFEELSECTDPTFTIHQ